MGALRLTLLKRSMRRWALPLRLKTDAPYTQRRQHGRDAGRLSTGRKDKRPLAVTQPDRDGLNMIETADRHRLGTARFRSFDSAALVNEKAASPAVSI